MATQLLTFSKKYGPCINNLHAILKKNNGLRIDTGGTASYRTRDARRNNLKKCFTDLYNGGFQLESPKSLKPKHIQFLVDKWVEDDISASSFNNYKSNIEALCNWINKPGMLKNVDLSVVPTRIRKRVLKAVKNKDWTTTPDFWSIINSVLLDDIVVGVQLLLMFAFGLRANEAMCLRVREADKGMFLYIEHGSKGGLKRIVDIENDLQRYVLDFAKQFVPGMIDAYSTTPKKYKLKQWRQHFYYICRKHGIKRANETVPHGLRHGYAQRVFEMASGVLSPIRSGLPLDKTDKINRALLKASKMLGHSRLGIMPVYVG